jgi:hypothetical protein
MMPNDPTLPLGPDPSPFSALPPPPAPGVTPVRNSPALNVAWLAIGSIAAVVGLVFGTVQTVGLLAHEEHTERITVSDPSVAVLDVATDDGRVEVIGADVDDVRITARISDGLVPTEFTHEVVGDRLQVRARCVAVITGPWCEAKLRIVVPRGMEVKVRSEDDPVLVRGLTGRVDAHSSNGSVEAQALSGAVQLGSSNGSVRAFRMRTPSIQAGSGNGSVRLEFAEPPRSVIADSDNGSVEVALPRGDQGYDVDIASDNGGTDNLVRTDSTSGSRVVATSNNGSVTVRYLD